MVRYLSAFLYLDVCLACEYDRKRRCDKESEYFDENVQSLGVEGFGRGRR